MSGGLARAQIILNDVLEIVHAVQINIVQIGHGRINIAGHRQIDHQHWAVSPLLQTCAHLRQIEH